jgi:putative toxin-antitoxin system antitoxin component (TIGR02293 family)
MAEIFGGAAPLGRAPRTIDDWRQLVEMGIPIEALSGLRRSVASSPGQAEALADVVFETADRRTRYVVELKGSAHAKRAAGAAERIGKLTTAESERAERIARLYALAEEALGNADEARAFLFSPHDRLDGHSPIDWMRTEIGGRNVEQLLVNIREAFPS